MYLLFLLRAEAGSLKSSAAQLSSVATELERAAALKPDLAAINSLGTYLNSQSINKTNSL